LGAVFLLVAAVAGIAIISSGRLDPQPAGPLQARLEARTIAIDGEETALDWQEAALPGPPASVRVRAASSGAESAVYGLALGGPEAYLAVAVSPAGITSVLIRHQGGPEETLVWRSVLGAEPARVAELQIDLSAAGEATAWVDRQVVWQGPWAGPGRQVGLLARGGSGDATVTFEGVELFGR
jgi:hypothetical protein